MRISNGNNLSRVKVSNQAAIREMIFHYGPISRGEVAERLSLTLPTITTTINTLLAKGILKEVQPQAPDGHEKKSLGRKVSLIDIAEDSRYFLGVEMRGSCRRACITNYRGALVDCMQSDTTQMDYDANMKQIIEMVFALLSRSGMTLQDISGIGICTPGLVDSQEGVLKIHPGYTWKDKNLREDLRQMLNYTGPITVDNNVVARAYGMKMFHQDVLKNAGNFAYLFVSLGIACPLFINEIGSQAAIIGFGEAGHMVMNPQGPLCGCGNHGCLETFSSEKAIIAQCREAMRAGRAETLRSLCAEPDAPTMQEILEAQRRGDSEVCGILDQAIEYLALAISNIYNFVSPQRMVIECILFTEESNRTRLIHEIRRGIYNQTISDVHFTFMDYDPLSGAIGAAASVIQHDLQTYLE